MLVRSTHPPTPPSLPPLHHINADEGTRRSLYFWSRAFPIYLHYRWVRCGYICACG